MIKTYNLILEDDLKIVLHVNKTILTCWFNIGFLRTFEKIKNLNSGYYNGLMFDPQGRIISKRMRYFKFAEINEVAGFYFDEFQSYDFDKWHKKSLEGKLPDNFSFFIGCFANMPRDSIIAIN